MRLNSTSYKIKQYKNYGLGQAEALILFLVCAIVGVTQVMVGKKGEVEA